MKSVSFGVKIGSKLSNPNLTWIEKWGTFQTADLAITDFISAYKYYCKFWHESDSDIKSESKLQFFNEHDTLTHELVEQGKL